MSSRSRRTPSAGTSAREECDRRNLFLAYGDGPRETPKRLERSNPAGRVPRTRVDREEDPILQYPLQTAFKILTGQPVPQSGMVRCPAPGHEDRRPSCHVGDALFCCFSCGVGGSAYDLGSLLSGIPTRGESFFELRKWLAVNLLRREEVPG